MYVQSLGALAPGHTDQLTGLTDLLSAAPRMGLLPLQCLAGQSACLSQGGPKKY